MAADRARAWLSLSLLALICFVPAIGSAEPRRDRLATTLPEAVRRLSFSAYRGVLHTVREDGGLGTPVGPSERAALKDVSNVVLLVHGSQYDPSRTGLPNPHATFGHVVRTHLDAKLTAVSFGWDSAPWSVKRQFAALFRGSLGVYVLARRNLDKHVPPLRTLIAALPPDWSAVCHSLGCELLLRTLDADPTLPRPRRIVLLSGDLREASFDRMAAASGMQVLAVRARRDFALSRSHFRRESRGFWTGRARRTSAWTDLMFYPERFEKGGRWSFRYSKKRRFWDHMSTFEFAQPWGVYNRFLCCPATTATIDADSGLEPLDGTR
jgi:hypothetical protein